MGNCLKAITLVLGLCFLAGCASSTSSTPFVEKTAMQRNMETGDAAADANQAITGKKLVKRARTAIGTPYVRGGSDPDGFDCSGFVKWAFKGVGVQLPRTAREQSAVGKKISNVSDMRAGDIVAFRHPKRGYHTGIYVGDGKFIHSPRKRSSVRITSLSDPYFSSSLLGARRINMDGGENLVAQAEEALAPTKNDNMSKSERSSARKSSYKKNNKKSAKLVASRSDRELKKGIKKSAKGKTLLSATSKNAKASKASGINKKRSSRTLAKNTAPVKDSSRQIAARKNSQKTVSMLQQNKSEKRGGKNNRS